MNDNDQSNVVPPFAAPASKHIPDRSVFIDLIEQAKKIPDTLSTVTYELSPLQVAWIVGMVQEARDPMRLMYAMSDFDGFANVEKDKYDFASEIAEERGHEEPTWKDELDGIRKLIDQSMKAKLLEQPQ